MKFDEGPRKAVRAKVKPQPVNPEAGAPAFFREMDELLLKYRGEDMTTVDRCPHCGEIKTLHKGECFCTNPHCFFGEDLEL